MQLNGWGWQVVDLHREIWIRALTTFREVQDELLEPTSFRPSLITPTAPLATMSSPVVVHTTPPLNPLPASDADSIRLLGILRLGGVSPGVTTADWSANGEPFPFLAPTNFRQALHHAGQHRDPGALPLLCSGLVGPRPRAERGAGGRRG
jgi:sorting and assembly machinery component 37